MASPLIDACLAALRLPPGGLPGMVAPTTLDRFELLQTPGLWGHDPADNSSWLAADGGPALPAASRRLLAAIEGVVASAESLLDIAALEPFATGDFLATIRRGLARAAHAGRRPTVRMLYGRHGYAREGFVSQQEAEFADFVADLAADVPPASGVTLHACLIKSCTTMPTVSWNHAKIIAADGRWAIVGGHNLWHEDYLSFAPVHDVSALVEGRAAGEAHVFLDTLWDWVGRRLRGPAGDAIVHAIRWSDGRTEAAPPPPRVVLPEVPAGRIPALALGRLGIGVLPDPQLANVAATVAAIAFRRATRTIRISQMDFALFFEGVNYWQADVIAALADVLTDPERTVEVSLVLSEHGAKTSSGGPYSFGTTPSDIVAEILRAIGGRPVTGRMRLAPLRISPQGEGWSHAGRSLAFANHAKVWIVDDHAFHVGSDNLYFHFLQEFGYLVESESLTADLVRDYWTPLWKHSARAAVDVV
ncbi:MAG: hypothetical protein ACKO4T_03050 [Planctomycetaceae bacterium]